MTISDTHSRIPVSVSLEAFQNEDIIRETADKKRILFISVIAVTIAICISFIGKLLVLLINLITNLSFHYNISTEYISPAVNNLGPFVIVVPVIGGLIIGYMALYGSRAIRGHGIPEAMEQILTNNSKIRPSVTYLKPLSAAISIGTGGPFGSEGPIIATGGALGSTFGQLLKISSYERKILLSAGATAGMSAIFGSPIAAIFLAIELLLFEFSPRSIIPVALACITGGAGHHLLFEAGPVFPTPFIESPGNIALAVYSVIGIFIGLISAFVTKAVYFIEDLFEKVPVHWKWWPAIGGLVVGVAGYFSPATLGVGYENITHILSGEMAIAVVVPLCILKFVSWSVSLGSGTSGGTLAPLLTIGSALGAIAGIGITRFFPGAGISISLAALVAMSAMFAGASRAVLTSIIFALETTGQSNALLPLLAACIASYVISFLFLKNTIMTEKIARRGVNTPTEYEPDILDKISVKAVSRKNNVIIGSDMNLQEVRTWLLHAKKEHDEFYIISGKEGEFQGIVKSASIFNMNNTSELMVSQLAEKKPFAVADSDNLKNAVRIMATHNIQALPVVSSATNNLAGILSYKDILPAYRKQMDEHRETIAISLRRQTLKLMIRGKQTILRKP